MKTGRLVIVLAAVLAILVCIALVITFGAKEETPTPSDLSTQQTLAEEETTQPEQQMTEATEVPMEVTTPQEGEGSPFDDMEMGDGPVIDVEIGGDEEGPAPTTRPTNPTNPTDPSTSGSTPTEPSQPAESQPVESKPSSGSQESGDSEWDVTIDFSELLKP